MINAKSPDEKSIAIIALTKRGLELGRRLSGLFPGSHLYFPEKFAADGRENEYPFPLPAKKTVREAFPRYRSLVMVMAVGVAVRLVSGELRDKHTDPAVVVVDDAGTFAVSLLSGHIGGANTLARKIASLLGAQPVVTTASEVNHSLALDLLGREAGWAIEDGSDVTAVSAALLNSEPIAVYQDAGETDWQRTKILPRNLTICDNLERLAVSDYKAALLITDRLLDNKENLPENRVVYRPRSLVVGIGCNSGTPCSDIEAAVLNVFKEHRLSFRSIRQLATIDIKRDEPGLQEFARKYSLPVEYFPKETLSRADFLSSPSPAALEYTGTPAVCESAAILSGKAPLIVPKVKFSRAVTIAVARIAFDEKRREDGRLSLVGLGPGDPQHTTFRARQAIDESDVIVGYDTYIKLIEQLLSHKEVITTGMRSEIERARLAIDLARTGKKVAVVCSGDSGVYGMAGLVGELIRQRKSDFSAVEIIPGVPALVACAALLGAPLTGDFASVSLSDYLVPWEEIVKRLELAAQGDFVIALYNPRSKTRQRQVVQARDILLRYRSADTPVGIVTNAYRQGQKVEVTNLEHMLEFDIGMTTTIIVGNSTTFAFGGRMVTSRGYIRKYSLSSEAL
ncbi:MAG: precorrin-3B C(17)-methyltransferase [Chloroflexi bacterium]|nr:precorrin-3B C(17)-methyltransferase [Chloroflexota bacterium]